MKNNFSAMILAAGFGKRLLPLTKNIPKPLISINSASLLDNAINFVKSLGCNEIIINTHYFSSQIVDSINQRMDKNLIKVIYEKDILDTGGAVKNAIPYFNNQNIIIINSDIFWIEENIIDAKKIIKNFLNNYSPHLLLSVEGRSFGILKNKGDFIIIDKKIKRFEKGNEILFYAGLQILDYNILNNFSFIRFSFNKVWDYLIKKENLFGQKMLTNWYHVGAIHGLNIARKLRTCIKQ